DVAEPIVADLTHHDHITGMAMAALASITAPRFALAGLSMGGYVAQEIMRLAPHRVDRLALLDTTHLRDTPEGKQRRRDLITLASQGDFKGVTPRLLPLFIHPDRMNDAPLVDAITAMTHRVGKEAFLRQQTAILGRPDGTWDLERIQCRTLVLCGRYDALTPLDVHVEMANHIPKVRLDVIEDSGHLPTMERPQAVNDSLRRWLTAETWTREIAP
ncbi:MAG: alpha/beta fold hydrolase, partial [Rhodobacterales bacterium]|nr:alpha/beta fold hydrolase [Rhodobacterales bacterium]